MTLLSLQVSALLDGIFRGDGCFTFPSLCSRVSSLADQTPTPTRFLKNCEEVGLFNELASPFDHDFKKATEDEIKKVVLAVKCVSRSSEPCLCSFFDHFWLVVVPQLPLDLSPLATPIIRNKIEEPTVIETHRDSPLPHPESTTNDDKVGTLSCLWHFF